MFFACKRLKSSEIETSLVVKNLGVKFDYSLDINNHVKGVARLRRSQFPVSGSSGDTLIRPLWSASSTRLFHLT